MRQETKNWTTQDDSLLRDYVKSNMNLREICESLGRSEMAVILRVRYLSGFENRYNWDEVSSLFDDQNLSLNDIYKRRNQRWTKEEDNTLLNMFRNAKNVREIAYKLDRSVSSIISRLYAIHDNGMKLEALFKENKRFLSMVRIKRAVDPTPEGSDCNQCHECQ